jgi:hypothetical protein
MKRLQRHVPTVSIPRRLRIGRLLIVHSLVTRPAWRPGLAALPTLRRNSTYLALTQ